MPWPLSFGGQIRLPYAVCSCVVFFVQHLVVVVAFRAAAEPLQADWRFFAIPLRSVAQLADLDALPALAAFILMLVTAWALAGLAFRRAFDSGLGPSFARR